jgi:hypothetical protein
MYRKPRTSNFKNNIRITIDARVKNESGQYGEMFLVDLSHGDPGMYRTM